MLSKSEIKYIQTLFQKKFRDAENSFLIEGPKIVDEALKSPGVVVKKIFALKEWAQPHATQYPKISITEISEAVLEKISQLKTPNQVVALLEKKAVVTNPPDLQRQLVLALDGIQDPGNLGTIIRIADWFGIPGIICSADCADVYNSKVIQATMGSLFRIPLTYTGLPEWIAAQPAIPVYGAVLNGTPLRNIKKVSNGILVVGNESKGIRPAVDRLLTQKITIEKSGTAESLNAAVATGILLSHLK